MLERCREVEAHRPDHRVIAQPDPRAPVEAGAVGEVGGVDVAAFDERRDADRLGDAVADLAADLEAGDAALRHA